MAQEFPERAHLNIDIKKYSENYDEIDWSAQNRTCGNCLYGDYCKSNEASCDGWIEKED